MTERSLEMLSQARAISFDVTPSPFEAALLEPDEIKRHRPPYNVALTIQDRALWFTSLDLSARSSQPSPHCPLGPCASAATLDQFAALARADCAALTSGLWGPDAGTFNAGYERLCATHPELSGINVSPYAKLLRLGTRLWREGRRDRDVEEGDLNEMGRRSTAWSPELVQASLEWLALRAALARRRAIWLTRLFDSSVVWREPCDSHPRLIVIENGEVVLGTGSRRKCNASDSTGLPPSSSRASRSLHSRLLRSVTSTNYGAEALGCGWSSSGAAPGRRTGARRVATRVRAVVAVMADPVFDDPLTSVHSVHTLDHEQHGLCLRQGAGTV